MSIEQLAIGYLDVLIVAKNPKRNIYSSEKLNGFSCHDICIENAM